MPYRTDYALQQRRNSCTAALSSASLLVDTMQEKCGELLALTDAEVAGNPIGDNMVARLRNSIETLRQSRATLLQAVETAHRIDVTYWEPEPENDSWRR